MNYGIYFDESNKLDQTNCAYSYYGALGAPHSIIDQLIASIQELNNELHTKSELHFVDYTSDTYFEKYFRSLNIVIEQDIKINVMIVNREDASKIAHKMDVTLLELRELFYVKIPERLFYGVTRNLQDVKDLKITIDQNNEYNKIDLEKKLEEQMNAHSAYRNKGYKIKTVEQASSSQNIALQLIDIFIGMIVFLLEKQYKNEDYVGEDNLKEDSTTKKVKSDLIYRFLIHNNNLEKLQKIITLYKWEGEGAQVKELNLSEYTGEFLIYKTQYDIQEMNKLMKLKLENPNQTTKFYREKMEYNNRQLRTIQGYLSEINGDGRNGYYINKA